MKYPIVISYHIISQQIISSYISIYTLPQKKEFVLKLQENKNIDNKDILRNIIIIRVLKVISM